MIEKLVIPVYRGDTEVDIDANRFDLFSISAAGNLKEIPYPISYHSDALPFMARNVRHLERCVGCNALSSAFIILLYYIKATEIHE